MSISGSIIARKFTKFTQKWPFEEILLGGENLVIFYLKPVKIFLRGLK